VNWQEYWNKNRIVTIENDNDLLYQAEWTVDKKVIDLEIFRREVIRIKNKLDLSPDDIFLDLCCGNGVLTYELSKYVSVAYGVDFSKPFVENAIRYKSAPNINYVLHDIKKIEDFLKNLEILPNKVLMNGSLAYFTDAEVKLLLSTLAKYSPTSLKFFLGTILDKDKIWRFYNTPSRKWDYLIKYKLLGKDIGLSRWWTKKKLEKLCNSFRLKCQFIDQDPSLPTAHYRFDVLICKEKDD